MDEKHWIEWIELNANGASYKVFLDPGQEPKAFFAVDDAEVTVRAYCNLHGLWKD